MKYTCAAYQSGFTLIELVSVVVLLGVLAVTTLPRYTGNQDFDAYTSRDQIIAGARMAQQRAMYDRSGTCYTLNIGSNNIRVQRDDVVGPPYIGPTTEWRNGIAIDTAISIAADTDVTVFFWWPR